MPAFRFVATADTDFYGSDLEPLFDTDLPGCLRALESDDSSRRSDYRKRAISAAINAYLRGGSSQ